MVIKLFYYIGKRGKKQVGNKEYYLGLDLGTNSVGWAVTDERYKLQRFNNKDMWGARLFDEASTAAERRVHRSTRRRLARKKRRIQLLQELFAEEIYKVDPTFFMRLRESKFHFEDKKIGDKHTLFNDDSFSDKEYYEAYPTIYHLRNDLMVNAEKRDIRLVYLALHHIVKYRGHFLFEGQKFSVKGSFDGIISNLASYLLEEYNFEIPSGKFTDIELILLNKELKIADKIKNLVSILGTKNKQFKSILSAMVGRKVSVAAIYNDPQFDEFKDEKYGKVDFKSSNYQELRDDYAKHLNENIALLDYLNSVYSWMILTDILHDTNSISEAKIKTYRQHASDLTDLKFLIKKYGEEGEFRRCFIDKHLVGNYTSYVSTTLSNGKYQADKGCSQEVVNKFFEKRIKALLIDEEDRARFDRIRKALVDKVALPKLRNTDNSVIPYQVHKLELDSILRNASKHYPFLTKVDDTGYSVIDKVKKIMTFRIPYYIGPLNTYHSGENGGDGNAWMVRKSSERITPWNFDKVVDVERSAERFIRRMTNKCTYVIGADVIPNESLLYEKFKVLNELNNLKLDGKSITVELKQLIFDELFKKCKKVTQKLLKAFLKRHGYENVEELNITGVDGDFKSSLSSYIQFSSLLGEMVDFNPTKNMVENIIHWKCIFESGGRIANDKIDAQYSSEIEEKALRKIKTFDYSGWGKLSKEFLVDIKGVSLDTGESFNNILDALEKTNENLMGLLSSKYTFIDELEKINSQDDVVDVVSYDNVMKDVNLSPGIKRTVWQAITICEEIKKIRKMPPKRIFIETTRQIDARKLRKDSRRDDLIQLYKGCQDDVSEFIKELESLEDRDLKARNLYLYYTQKGRCMYSGEKIDLETLLSTRIYDRDHIYPQSLTKDDSLDNLVLVKRTLNINKSDKTGMYPGAKEIRNKMISFWAQLKEQGFISTQKFYRLTRTEPLSTEELAGFINRQLVETSQATKTTAEILKRIYPDTEIVYIKSKVVSEFRHQFNLLKSRELNNFHHAHDAFLNIVAGNSYHTKFTSNPYRYIKKEVDKGNRNAYNLDKFFSRTVSTNGMVAWDKEVHLPFVIKTLDRPTVNVVRMPFIQKGKLFNDTLERKTTGTAVMVPIKGRDERLSDFSKYGGYINLKGAYFFVVEHTAEKGRIRTFEQVLLMHASQIKSETDLACYCQNYLKLVDPLIIVSKIKMGSKLIWDGFPVYLQSRTKQRVTLSVGKELTLNKEKSDLYRRIVKEYQFSTKEENSLDTLFSDDELLSLFETYLELLKEGEYRKRFGRHKTILEAGRGKFEGLPIRGKLKTLIEIHKIFNRNSLSGVDLVLVGGSEKSAIMTKNKDITGSDVMLINESPTGLFENRKVLNKV